MSAFIAALRISRRDALRSKGRSALIVTMIGLPVLVITCFFALYTTTEVNAREGLTATIGAADADIRTTRTRGALEQQPDAMGYSWGPDATSPTQAPWGSDQVAALIEPGTRLLPHNIGSVEVRSPQGYDMFEAIELDLRDPLAQGMRMLREGRLPSSTAEVAVTPELIDRGSPEIHARAGRPRLGLALVVAGLGATYLALRDTEVWILAAAVLVQLGLVALMPWLVKVSGRLASRLPLPLRLSVRDASRHRGRTASAAAAVMAATPSVLAVAIWANSDYVERRDAYRAGLPIGTLSISGRGQDDATWAKVKALAAEHLPGVTLMGARDATEQSGKALGLGFAENVIYGHDLPIGDQQVLRLLQGRDDPKAAAALADGKAVVFDEALVRDGMVSLQVAAHEADNASIPLIKVPAVVAKAADPNQGGAVLAREGIEQAGYKTAERRLYAHHVPRDDLQLERTVMSVASRRSADVYLERGFQGDIAIRLGLLLAGAIVLVLGGTLVATRLAAADLRPEQATMAAIGAPPLTRRLVLAAQAGYIAGLGALVGALAGAVTGIALTMPGGKSVPVAIPWLFMVAVVLGLPALAALVAGAFTREGRLALTRRLT